jgi:hypothetical protein
MANVDLTDGLVERLRRKQPLRPTGSDAVVTTPATAPETSQVKRADDTLSDQLCRALDNSPDAQSAPAAPPQPTSNLPANFPVDLVRRGFASDPAATTANSGSGAPVADAPATRPRRVSPAPTGGVDLTEGLSDFIKSTTRQPPKSETEAQTTPPTLGTQTVAQPMKTLPRVVEYDPDDQQTRERVARPLEYSLNRYDQDLIAPKPKDHNGRLKSALIGAARGALQGAASQPGNPLAGAIGGAGAGALSYGIKPSLDEESAQGRDTAEDGSLAGQLLSADRASSQNRLAKANADYAETVKPEVALGGLDVKRDAADAKAVRDEQQAVLSVLRLRKGQRLDPSNPRDAALLARAARAGVTVNSDEWNNASSNLASIEVVDPENPTQKRRQFYNKVTGEIADAGQSGYVAPVHSDTELTSNQEGLNADRDASRLDLEGQRKIQNELARIRIKQGDTRINLAQASQDNRFSQQTRKELGDAEKLRAESERWQSVANNADKRTRYFDPDSGEWKESKKWAEKRDEAAARAESLRGQLYGSYGYLWGGQMSRADFLRNHPALSEIVRRSGSKENPIPTGEIDNYAKKYGITWRSQIHPPQIAPTHLDSMDRPSHFCPSHQ